MRTLVLGLGNLLLCDEGIGVHVARALIEAGVPENVTVLDIGTAILDAIPAIQEADRIVVVDAVMADEGVPGSIYRMSLDAFTPNSCIASMHGFDLSRVFALTGRSDQPDVTVIGVEPAHIEWSMDLSPKIAEILPKVVEIVRGEIEASPGDETD